MKFFLAFFEVKSRYVYIQTFFLLRRYPLSKPIDVYSNDNNKSNSHGIDKHTAKMSDVISFVFYAYKPSMAGAVIFVILFAIAALYHIWLLVRNRVWYFIPFVIGCLCKFFQSVWIKLFRVADQPDLFS